MASLVSPGVSVTITDESFFIPASAPTVPLIFMATADEKVQPDENSSPALGTYESNVVRTITSLTQSVETYGIPTFLEDATTGIQHHGDARNEYGLFALNQYLGIGNRAYVVRADVNLNDNLDDIRTSWDSSVIESSVVLQGLINDYIANYNLSAISTAAQEITDITVVGDTGSPASDLDGKYFTLDAPGTGYYVWYTDGTGGSPVAQDPAVAGRTGIMVSITNGDTANTIAALTRAAITAEADFTATVVDNVVTVTNAAIGAVTDAADGALATNFTFDVTTQGGDATPEISTVNATILKSLARTSMEDTLAKYSFQNLSTDFFTDTNLAPLLIYPNGYDNPPVPVAPAGYNGFDYEADSGTLSTGSPAGEYTATTGSALLIDQSDSFKYTLEFFNLTKLGPCVTLPSADTTTS